MGSGSSFLEMWAGEHNGLLSMDTVQEHRTENKLLVVWLKDK